MNTYLLLKFIHILSAAVLAGTGSGIAFFMFMAHRSRNPQAIMVTARHVVLADWLFTTPAVIVQLTTGLWLMHELAMSFSSIWFLVVIGLFVFIGLCWLPVVYIQYRLRDIGHKHANDDTPPKAFHRLMRLWTALGIPAFISIVIMFWLMVFKPLPVT